MMRAAPLVAIAALLVAHAAPAAEDGCADADAAQFAAAQQAHRSGAFESALELSERLSACHPDNVDYQFQRALALAALGRDDAALAAARTAKALAPEYDAVSALVERLEARLAAAEAPPATETPRNGTGREPAIAAAATGTPWLANAFVSAHDLSGGRDGWLDAAIGLRRIGADGFSIGGTLAFERRGDVGDWHVAADVVYPVSPRTRVTGRVGVTPGANFRPGVLTALGAQRDLDGGWLLRGEVAQRRFDGDRADNLTLGADWYVASFRLAGAVTVSRLASAGSALGGVVSADWYASDRHRYRVTASLGDELDTIDEAGTVLESRVRALTVAGEHAVRGRLSLGWWLGVVEQGNFYDRRHAGLSVTRRF